MPREEIFKQMEEMLGVVPTMFKSLPDATLELEWKLFQQVQIAPGAIPEKYRELIGLAMAGASKCRYCAFYHAEMAKLHGATPEEIQEALAYAKSSAGWSTYLNGMQIDYEQFKWEITTACQHVRQGRGAMGPGDISE